MAFGANATLQDNANRANGNVSVGSTFAANKAQNATGATSVVVASEKFATTGDQNFLSASTWGPDLEYYCTISTLPTQYLVLSGRITGGNTSSWNGYAMLWGPAVGEIVQIRRYASGTNTTIESSSSFFPVAGDKLGLQIIGTKISVWWWRVSTSAWQEVVSKTDATYTAAGNLGWWAGDSTGRYDDIFAGTVGGEATKLVVPAAAKSIFVPNTPTIQRILAAGTAAPAKWLPAAPKPARKAAVPAAAPATWLPAAPKTARKTAATAALALWRPGTPSFATVAALLAPAAVSVRFAPTPALRRLLAAPAALMKASGATPTPHTTLRAVAAQAKLTAGVPTPKRHFLAVAALAHMRALAPTLTGGAAGIPEHLLPNTAAIAEFLAAAVVLAGATEAAAAVQPESGGSATFGDTTSSAIVTG